MLATAYYFLQVVICSGLMTAYYWIVLRNKRFHQYNRFYLLAITLLAWIVPLIKIQLNHRTVTDDPQMMQLLMLLAQNNTQIDAGISQPTPGWAENNIPLLIYLAVATVLLFFMIRALVRLHTLLKNHSCKSVGDVYLILTTAKGTPFSFFRYIFWNEEIDLRSESGKQILQHELTHVQQKHSIDKIFMQLVLIAGWFNPFFWLIRKEMDMIHEFIADKKAVNNGDTASLAQMLLLAAYPQQRFALTNPFFSPIKRRLQMLANTSNPRFSYIRRLVVLPLLAAVTVLFAFRHKEQREDATLSVASVMENVISDLRPVGTKAPAATIVSDTIVTSKGQAMELEKGAGGVVTLRLLPDTALPRVKAETLNQPLVFVDGKRIDKSQFDKLDPMQIQDINILKDAESIAQYGEEGKNGVILIRTKKPRTSEQPYLTATSVPINGSITDTAIRGVLSATTINGIVGNGVPAIAGSITGGTFANKNGLTIKFPDTVTWTRDGSIPLIMIDGVKGSLGDIKPDEISRVEVLKNDRATAKYGNAGKSGAIEVSTYRLMEELRPTITSVGTLSNLQSASPNITTLGNLTALTVSGRITTSTVPTITSRGELVATGYPMAPNANALVPPSFPGGEGAWINYVERNRDNNIPARNGAPPGRYNVIVLFEVAADGSVKNVHADTDPGFGTKDEAIRVVAKTPKWKPATYNGSVVKYNAARVIIFTVGDGRLDPNKLSHEPR